MPVSATLAAHEVIAARRNKRQPVLPLAFGEAGLPVHPALRRALAAATTCNGYGPVAGQEQLRSATAGYWTRRGLPTGPDQVVCGPGSKPLLFGLLLALGAGVALPRPSWVSYAAQAAMIGIRAHFVPAAPGEGGIPDPAALDAAATTAAATGRPIRSVVVTLPDNPTGLLPRPATVRALCQVAEAHGLVIISDEIYRDLVHDPAVPVLSPAQVAPKRTVVTTGLSKSLALGGWRLGVARMPDGPFGDRLRVALLGIGSEIWSASAAPVQRAAVLAFTEPAEITARIAASRSLHATIARAVTGVCITAGLTVSRPQAAFYLYPDFEPWRDYLRARHRVTTSAGLARLLLERYGAATLPASAFGEPPAALRLRLATSLLYGDTGEQREAALTAPDPLALPWIAAALARLEEILADLTGPALTVADCRAGTRGGLPGQITQNGASMNRQAAARSGRTPDDGHKIYDAVDGPGGREQCSPGTWEPAVSGPFAKTGGQMHATRQGGIRRGWRRGPAGPVVRLAAAVLLLGLAAVGSLARESTRLSTVGLLSGPVRPVTAVAGVAAVAGCLVLAGALILQARRERPSRVSGSSQPAPLWARVVTVLAILALLALAFTVVLVAFASGRGGGHGFQYRLRPAGEARAPVANVAPYVPSLGHSSGTAGTAALLVAVVVAAVAAAVAVVVLWLPQRPAAAPPRQAAGPSPLAAAVAAGSSAFGATAGVREAIIACYAAMEDTLAAAGAPRRNADTPEELLDRAIRNGVIRTQAAQRLTSLFREARFSSHELAEAQRQAAWASLADISHDLSGMS